MGGHRGLCREWSSNFGMRIGYLYRDGLYGDWLNSACIPGLKEYHCQLTLIFRPVSQGLKQSRYYYFLLLIPSRMGPL